MLARKTKSQVMRTQALRRSRGDLLAALIERSGPHAAPSEEEILSLILEELPQVRSRWLRNAPSK